MTTEQLIIGITLKLSNNVKFRTIDNKRLLYFLNLTQKEMVTDSLILNKTSNLFGYHNITYELIQPFIDTKRLNVEKNTIYNSYFFSLPIDYLLILENSQLIDSSNNIYNIKILKTSSSSNLSVLPYYKNNSLFTNVLEYDNKIHLLEFNKPIKEMMLFYIREPSEITLVNQTKLNSLYHVTLLEKTVSNILKSFEDINSLNINETKI